MFSWLEGNADHPIYNLEQARRLLADLPEQPLQALDDITARVDSFRGTSGFHLEPRIEVAELLDETGRTRYAALFSQYLAAPHLQDFQGMRLWQAMHAFVKAMAEAYGLCVEEYRKTVKPSAEIRERMQVVWVRLLRLLAERMKLELMRYLDVDQDVWDGLCRYYQLAEANGFADAMVIAYAGQVIHTSAMRELLCALALHESAPDTLAPDQIEVSYRIVARMVSFFEFSREPCENCPYFIDLDHPMAPAHAGKDPQQSPGMRFFGMSRAIPRLEEIMHQNERGLINEERRFGNEFTPDGKLTVLRHLRQYWSNMYLHRLQERRGIHTDIEVVHGFGTVSKLVAQVELDSFVGLSPEEADMLQQRGGVGLANAGEKYASENWVTLDFSPGGLGALIPQSAGDWAKIGALCGLKGKNAARWWVGTIRRLKTDNRNRVHAGIEILTKKPLLIWLRAPGKDAKKAANRETGSGSFEQDCLPAILLADARNSYVNATMLMEPGGYVPEAVFEAMMGEKNRKIRLVRLLAEGEDYEQVQFEWLETE